MFHLQLSEPETNIAPTCLVIMLMHELNYVYAHKYDACISLMGEKYSNGRILDSIHLYNQFVDSRFKI